MSFVNGLGQYDLPTTVNVKDWETVNISADFLHTTLWVEKTQIGTDKDRLTTLTTDSMTYKTNALPNDISVGCDTKVDNKDVISISNNETTKTLKFTVNPNIPFSSYTTENKESIAKVWIKAGNIKKYIDVYYSAKPFLIVTPQQEVIYWTKEGDPTLTKTLTFKTNLGGILFQASDFYSFNGTATGGVLSYGKDNSKVLVNCTSNTGATGTITVTAQDDPGTTTEHTFTVLPLKSEYESYKKEVKVTVKPAVGYYRIYMRAINDLQKYANGVAEEWQSDKLLAEDYTSTGYQGNNWRDGWTDWNMTTTTADGDANNMANNHYAYIYTQIGETESEKDKMPAWLFTDPWPGDRMTDDGNNPGWYYINEKIKKESTGKVDNNSTETKIIKPGETLIIFNNNTNQKAGYTLHRFSHHLDPGIPLFNYDDKEGWYLYDPTCDPYYRVFDDKPKVEDITYEIYTSEKVTGWYHRYGVGANTTTPTDDQMFKIHSDNVSSEKSGSWYKTTLTFKCPHGYYEKAIKLKLEGVTDEPVLFGGHNWTPTNNTITGYYDGSSWHKDDPTSSAKRRR